MLAKFTDIVILLDASASMLGTADLTRKSLIEFIEGQKAVPGEANLTLVEFSEPSKYRYLLANVPLASFESSGFKYTPMGQRTALQDAWSRLIDERGARYASLPEYSRPEKVIFVVITDGYDNASTTPSYIVQNKVKHQEQNYSWDFVYLGANQEAEVVAANYGILKSKALSYDAAFVGSVGQSLGNYVSLTRSGLDAVFTAEDKSKAKGGV